MRNTNLHILIGFCFFTVATCLLLTTTSCNHSQIMYEEEIETRMDSISDHCPSTFYAVLVPLDNQDTCCRWELVITNPEEYGYNVKLNGIDMYYILDQPIIINSCGDNDIEITIALYINGTESICFIETVNCSLYCCSALEVSNIQLDHPDPGCCMYKFIITGPEDCLDEMVIGHFLDPTACSKKSKQLRIDPYTYEIVVKHCCLLPFSIKIWDGPEGNANLCYFSDSLYCD